MATIVVVAAGCQAPEVTIVLTRDDSIAAAPPFVMFHMVQAGEDDDVSGPFDTDTIPAEQFSEVPPGEELVVDVYGCGSSDACDDPEAGGQLVARGCSEPVTLKKGEETRIPVELHLPPAPDCPGG